MPCAAILKTPPHILASHDLRFKAMSGGLMAYLDEKPCAWLSSSGLALKLAPIDQLSLLQLTGAARLIAKPGAGPSRHYIIVPATVCRYTQQLAGWLTRSASACSDKFRSRRPRR